jgi:protein-S-isoprenylcysteine O-methyltransferase Ste14
VSVLGAGAFFLFFHPSRPAVLSRLVLPACIWLTWGGVVVTALGLAFATWARVHLGRLWSASVTLKADHMIVRTGPYAMSRHPIYTGLVLAFIGTTLVYATVGCFVGLVLLTLGILLKIRQEEELLLGHFGDAYRGYQADVPALIPRFRSPA